MLANIPSIVTTTLLGTATLSHALPIYDVSSSALAVRDTRTELVEYDHIFAKRVSTFGQKFTRFSDAINGVFVGATCAGTACMAYPTAKAAAGELGYIVDAGFWGTLVASGLKVVTSGIGAFIDQRVPGGNQRRDLRTIDPRAYTLEFEPFANFLINDFEEAISEEHHEFFMGLRDDCELSSGGKYGHLRIGRVKGAPRTIKITREYWNTKKRAPGSIEAYVQDGQDNGYPPDNGWLDEAAYGIGELIDSNLQESALCMRTKNYLNSEAFWYMAVDADDVDDQFTGVVECDYVNYD